LAWRLGDWFSGNTRSHFLRGDQIFIENIHPNPNKKSLQALGDLGQAGFLGARRVFLHLILDNRFNAGRENPAMGEVKRQGS
jgi:hypothetical protein